MSRKTPVLFLILAAAALTAIALPAGQEAAPQAAPPAAPTCEDWARFISGYPCDAEPLKALQATAAWKDFAAALDKNWADLEEKRLKPMREWAAKEFPDVVAGTKLLFYPFGGPDILTAYELYPQAEVFVLLGLELVGRLPKLETDRQVAGFAGNLGSALSDFFNKSYFITKHMDETIYGTAVEGVLPILCLFLKRTGNSIVAVSRCDVIEPGELIISDFEAPRLRTRRPYGVKIEFQTPGWSTTRAVYYFSCDLQDKEFSKDSAFHKFLAALPFESTYFKSASYLPHYETFSNIRDLVLAGGRFVLEDDTGIPYRYFKPAEWDAQLYGQYVKPIKDFSGVEQTDLKAAYADPAKVKKLPFHLGYHWRTSEDSILLFRRKGGPSAGGGR